jgi:hypothetical protein
MASDDGELAKFLFLFGPNYSLLTLETSRVDKFAGSRIIVSVVNPAISAAPILKIF